LISLTVDTAKRDQQTNGSCIAEIRTQDASQGLDFVLVTAGRERTDHIMIQLQPDPLFSMQPFAMDEGRARLYNLLIVARLRRQERSMKSESMRSDVNDTLEYDRKT
jgi:hypothetical protein